MDITLGLNTFGFIAGYNEGTIKNVSLKLGKENFQKGCRRKGDEPVKNDWS